MISCTDSLTIYLNQQPIRGFLVYKSFHILLMCSIFLEASSDSPFQSGLKIPCPSSQLFVHHSIFLLHN